jgi:hypothetical protein
MMKFKIVFFKSNCRENYHSSTKSSQENIHDKWYSTCGYLMRNFHWNNQIWIFSIDFMLILLKSLFKKSLNKKIVLINLMNISFNPRTLFKSSIKERHKIKIILLLSTKQVKSKYLISFMFILYFLLILFILIECINLLTSFDYNSSIYLLI